MEKIHFNRLLKGALIAGIGMLGLSACGQTDPPTPKEFNDGIEFITLDGVYTPEGQPVRCVMYGAESSITEDSKSWFGFDCDFEGVATFPTNQG